VATKIGKPYVDFLFMSIDNATVHPHGAAA
jgi:hypothetical protein